MYKNKSIGVIVPAYNEEILLPKTLETMPSYVDKIFVIDDFSADKTLSILKDYQKKDSRIQIIIHESNKGLGQSLIDGYLEAISSEVDITAVMAGDNQMSPDDLPAVLDPIVNSEVDYVKGNRLLRDDVTSKMPRHRYIGNSILTLLTKFATGYWKIIDPQCGYTAISLKALKKIPIQKMTKGYGYNADILNMLNLKNQKVQDVEVKPVYGQEKSKIKLTSYIPLVSKLLLKLFFRRMMHKYLIRDFHPLALLYFFSLTNLFLFALPLKIRFFYLYFKIGYAPQTTLILLTFAFTIGFLSLILAMWMDMEDNRILSK